MVRAAVGLLSRCLLFAAVLSGVGVIAYGCTGSTTGITPITGIVVRADTLIQGHGCGTEDAGPSDIYEYVAIVSEIDEASADQVYIAGGAFRCYADATFVNLCASSTGSYVYGVAIVAYTQSEWTALGGDPTPTNPTANTAINALNRASYCTADAGNQSPIVVDPNYPTPSVPKGAYTTTCTATQQSDIEVLAVCAPLSATP
jgi:hypothetical protein